MTISKTALEGVLIIEPKVFGDHRGFFLETFHAARYKELAGIELEFVQDNYSSSLEQGVLRGLHFQKTKPQGKLVRCVRGEIYDVAVDISPNSKTYGHYVSVLLTAENKQQLYVPPGFAHGFQVVSEEGADVEYKCTDYYDPSDEGSIIWNDPKLAIKWPLSTAILSGKDAEAPTLASLAQ